jgi:hypothetical protein
MKKDPKACCQCKKNKKDMLTVTRATKTYSGKIIHSKEPLEYYICKKCSDALYS